MKGKSLIILLVLTLGALSYIYFAIEKPAKEKEMSGGKEDLLAPGALTSIKSFKITAGDKKIDLERETIGWRMLAPTKDLASQSKVENLVSALERFKKSRVLFSPAELDSKKPDLAQYGLNPPKVTIEYKASDLAEPVVLQLGSPNPSNTATYAKTAKEGVVMATMDLDFLGTQSPDDFREMRLTTVSGSDYDEVGINAKGKKIQLKRSGEQWVMESPYQLPLDPDFTKSLIDKIGFIRVNQFLDKTPQSILNPDIKIVVGFKKDVKDLRSSESDTRPQGLEIALSRVAKPKAKKSKDETSEFDYFAKGDKTSAGSIAQFHFDNFLKSPEEFVKKTFDTFLSADVEDLSFSKGKSAPVHLIRTEKGFTLNNAKESLAADPEKATKLIEQIRSLRATKFVEILKSPKSAADLVVTLHLKDKKQASFAFDFGKASTLLWVSEGDKVLHYELPKEALSAKDFDFDALKPSLAKPAEPAQTPSSIPDSKGSKQP